MPASTDSRKLRSLGKNGPKLNPLGLGCMGLSAFYGTKTADEEAHKMLKHALDLNCNFWDTADIYGENEVLLAPVLKERRKDIFLCTKFGAVIPGSNQTEPCSRPEYVRSACEKSLKRLGVDYIDLYYQHRVDPTVPIEDTVRAMAELVKEGKVRYLGMSECSAETLRRAYKVHPIAAVQVEYSPWALEIETNGLLAACKELGVTVVAYSPLGRGFLTGRIKSPDDFEKDDWRRTNPRFAGENFTKNLELVKRFEAIAEKKKVPTSQLVLAWVLSQGPEFFAIPGTTKVKNLEQNLAALDIEISAEDDQAVRAVIREVKVHGTRYPEAGMKYIDI